MRSLRTKAEYLRETEAWARQQRREQLLRRLFYVAVVAAIVAVVVGWPCADAVCAPAG
jgi:type IV secretory pathway component VirB8